MPDVWEIAATHVRDVTAPTRADVVDAKRAIVEIPTGWPRAASCGAARHPGCAAHRRESASRLSVACTPAGCESQGSFQTWQVKQFAATGPDQGTVVNLDEWMTEFNEPTLTQALAAWADDARIRHDTRRWREPAVASYVARGRCERRRVNTPLSNPVAGPSQKVSLLFQ